MKQEEIPHRRYLDPRPTHEADAAPIVDSVNIPLSELPSRTGELPAREKVVRVVGEKVAEEAVEWLRAHGRKAIQIVKYQSTNHLAQGRLWEPNRWLWFWMMSKGVQERAPGSALDLGCGGGRDAVYLAAHKWRVTAIDRLAESPGRGREFASHYLDHQLQQLISWQVADLLDASFKPPEKYDLITSFFFFDRTLIKRAKGWLKPGGELVAEAFTTLRQEQEGKPTSPERVVKPGEMRELLSDLEIELYEEGHASNTVRVWARKGFSTSPSP